jgi:hypothetical protein
MFCVLLVRSYGFVRISWRLLLYKVITRGVECFDLTGKHVSRTPCFFCVEVAMAKNHPEGFSF